MTISMDQPQHGQQHLQDQKHMGVLPLEHSRLRACRGEALSQASHHFWVHSEEWS